MNKTKVFPVRIDEAVYEAVRVAAEHEGVNMSIVARWALEGYLTRYFSKKKNAKYLEDNINVT